ncbi:bombyxin F-1-like isoform X3 [Hyposmocoma kahamanoa]|uniref:bombyxin F-1-like isoform X3 n=1 Tax=Hyposmocoma kahamanoa TaxID=1477025 RepID=UPI000E6D7FB8|nr:bombyxin F-1-like isoform X3 [Hyposmocoma kahamanoa]
MLIDRAVQLAMVVVIMLWGALTDAAPRRGGTFKMCGRTLSHFMSHVCRVHNSPPSSWDVPTVVEQPASVLRRKRQSEGIADECCMVGCTREQLAEYCSVINPEVLDTLDTHLIEDRSAEQENVAHGAPAVPAIVGEEKQPHKQLQHKGSASEAVKAPAGALREVGSARSRGTS